MSKLANFDIDKSKRLWPSHEFANSNSRLNKQVHALGANQTILT